MRRHNAPSTFTAKMDAEHWLAAERRLIELDAWAPPAARVAQRKAQSVPLGEYAATRIEQRNVKPRTAIGYRELFGYHIAGPLGAIAIRNLTPEAVRAWYAALGTEHPTRNQQAYRLLRAICTTAVTDGLIPANPCTIAGVHTSRRRNPVVLSVAEVAALADAIKPVRLRALVLISAWCGLRWGEVTELRRKDIGDGAEVISVARAATHRQGCRIDTPKSGKSRTVVVPPHIRADIEHHLDTYVAEDVEALLFPAQRGCHLNDMVFRGPYIAALAAIGRDGVRVHDLRHFAGTQTARVGNLVETMGRLGHSTVKASLIYQQIVSGRDVEVADALSRLADGSG